MSDHKSRSPLYHLSQASQAESIVKGIAKLVDPKSKPQEYADAIFNAVKKYCSDNEPATALAIVDAAETDNVGTALLWIGQKYAGNRNFEGVMRVLEHDSIQELQATGVVSAYMLEFYDLVEGSAEHKNMLTLIDLTRFNDSEKQYLREELQFVFDRNKKHREHTEEDDES